MTGSMCERFDRCCVCMCVSACLSACLSACVCVCLRVFLRAYSIVPNRIVSFHARRTQLRDDWYVPYAMLMPYSVSSYYPPCCCCCCLMGSRTTDAARVTTPFLNPMNIYLSVCLSVAPFGRFAAYCDDAAMRMNNEMK